jgi:hypothetical protein
VGYEAECRVFGFSETEGSVPQHLASLGVEACALRAGARTRGRIPVLDLGIGRSRIQ